MKTCNCNTNTKIPILEEGVFPSCPPEKGEIFIYLREFEDTYKLYGYTHTKNEFRLDDLELLTFAVQGVTKMTYDGDYERTFNVIREDLDVYSKQEVTDLLSSAGIIVINSLNSDSTKAALSAAKGKELQQNKVDKESGKELSSNDFTNDYKTKLDSIQSGAQQNQPLKTVNHISLYASGSDTNIDIAKGDYTSIIFRQSETQPATPTGTNPVPSGWTTNITSSTGTWWMSSSLVNGQTGQASTWSVPIRIVGTNGNSITYVFKQSDTRPATPTGTAPIPSGWADAPTAVGKWWMSKATVSGQTGLVIGSWSVPVQTTAEDGIDGNYTDFKYAENSSTTIPPTLNGSVRNPPGWSDYPPALISTTYLWMTQATIVEDSLSGTWSVPVRISGENGKDGQWTSFVFRQSETQPATPTGTSIIPSGWSDAPSGTGTWWMSKSLINYLGQALEWTEPVRVTGNDGPQGVPGSPGEDGLVYYTWIRYADTETGDGISNDPAGKEYIGFAYNKTTPTESNNPLDYRWSLIKGTDGQPGAPGSNTYTWIKYSDYADGIGMYDLPTPNTQYIGIAVNKTTAVESTNKADYTWSKFKGDNGNWTSYALKQQSGQPTTPTDTTIIPSGWSDRPTSAGKWWMIKATISGSSNTVIGPWSIPVQVTGEDGVDGNYTDFKYAVNSSLTVYPTINRTVRNPAGWSDVPPTTGEDEYLWLTQAIINPDNTLSGQWSIPVRISGESGKDGEYTVYQYAKNTSLTVSPTSGWVTTPPSLSSGEYLWMRMGVVTPPATTPSSWSVPVRISGENGKTGEVGAMLVFMGFWNNSTEYTGTPSLRHIVRVDSGTTTYYIAKTTAGTFTGNLPTDTSKWEVFEANYKSIATEVLFAESANIGGWIFYKTDPGTPSEQQYLQSQNGTAVLNGTTGYVKFTSGSIGGFIVDVQGLKSPVGMNNSQIILSAGGRIFTLKQGTGSAESGLEMGFTGAGGSGKPYLVLYEEDYSIILTSLGLLGPSNSGFFVNVPEVTTGSLNLYSIASSDPHIVGRVYRDSSYNLKVSKG